MNMTTKTNISSQSSSLTRVTAPLIGEVSEKKNALSVTQQDEEYFLVEKLKALQSRATDEKKERKSVVSTRDSTILADTTFISNGKVGGGGRFGACKALLTYDFSITPSTSSTLQTVVALCPYSDGSFTGHWNKLFTSMRMIQAEVQLDFTEFVNPVGHDFALSPVVIGFVNNAFASTQYYADVSDWKTSKFAGYSTARPVVKYKVPPHWLAEGWTLGQEASNVGTHFGKWASTQSQFTQLNTGFVHIASQKPMFDTGRDIVGRLLLWMEFKGQL